MGALVQWDTQTTPTGQMTPLPPLKKPMKLIYFFQLNLIGLIIKLLLFVVLYVIDIIIVLVGICLGSDLARFGDKVESFPFSVLSS